MTLPLDLLNPNTEALDNTSPTLDQLTASSRNRQKDKSSLQSVIGVSSEDLAIQESQKPSPPQSSSPSTQSSSTSPSEAQIVGEVSDLESEADQQGAFNPATGEINWDCPCLGGMAYGPCGEEFRSAFSCFVYSNEEPKGMDCIEKFQGMQDCFRAHPEVYAGELEGDEELDEQLEQEVKEYKGKVQERIDRDGPEWEGEHTKSLADTEREIRDSTGETGGILEEVKSEVGSAVEGVKQSLSGRKEQIQEEAGRLKQNVQQRAGEAKQKAGDAKENVEQKVRDRTQDAPHKRATNQPQPEAKTKSHTPSGYSQDRESQHGADSKVTPQRRAPQTSADAMPESESLVPKAAHDATTETIEDDQGGKKSKA